jgi:FtsH-binding integral membrane protein
MIVAIIILFHVALIFKVIPYNIAWGGRLKNDKEMYAFELFSIFMNMFFGIVLLIKGRFIKSFISEKITNVILWIFFAVFCLNTIGNLFAKTSIEKSFSILTLLLAVLILLIVRKKKGDK